MIEYTFKHDGEVISLATTNKDDGLFVWGYMHWQPEPEWIQIEGTADFSVHGVKDKRGKIRRYLERNEWRFPYKVARTKARQG